MLEILTLTLKILSFTAGLFIIYLGFFLYENEEKNLKNYLEDFWIKIDDVSKLTLAFHKKVIVTSSLLLLEKLELIFGNKLISFNSFFVSYFLSFFSISLVLLYDSLYDSLTHDFRNIQQVLIFAVISFLFLWSSFKISKWKKLNILSRVLIVFTGLLGSISCFFGASVLFFFSYYDEAIIYGASLGIVLMVLSDFLFIVISLKLLMLASQKRNNLSFFFIFLSYAILIVLFTYVPLELGDYFIDNTDYYHNIFFKNLPANPKKFGYNGIGYAVAFWSIPYSSIACLIIATLLFFTTILYFIHIIFWPLLTRPIYGLQKYGVYEYKGVLIVIGFLLITWAIPDIRDLLEYFK